MKHIPVKVKDFGFFSQNEITVQRIEKHDDFDDVIWCNHAGYYVDRNQFNYKIEVCDKCPAWRYIAPDDEDYVENWQDAPELGEI